jgi:argininosuccinate lyase
MCCWDAAAGTTFDIDRHYVASRLGVAEISHNSLDAVSDRDFLLDLVYACCVIQMHLSRLAEELIIWSSDEFGFIRIDDEYSTGSSIMPQKKNPDYAELVRGKTGRVVGDLTALLVTLKGLPLAYNKDMQEDKEPAFDAVDTVVDSLRVMTGMIGTLHVETERMRAASTGGFMAATDLADYLVDKGAPFREAHETVGKLVLAAERGGKTLQQMSAEEYASHDARFGSDVADVIDVDKVVERRKSAGGTGHQVVTAQMEAQRDALDADEAWLENLGER